MDYLLLIIPLCLLAIFYYRWLYTKEKSEKQNIAKERDLLAKQQIFFIRKMLP